MLFVCFLSLTIVSVQFRYVVARSRFLRIFIQPTGMTAAKVAQTSAESLAEIAEILAAGLMRLKARKSSGLSADPGESSLDFSGHQSGHPTPMKRSRIDG